MIYNCMIIVFILGRNYFSFSGFLGILYLFKSFLLYLVRLIFVICLEMFGL